MITNPDRFICDNCGRKKSRQSQQCQNCRTKEKSERGKGRPALALVGDPINCTSCGKEHAKRPKTNKCETCRKRINAEYEEKSRAKKAAHLAANKGWNHELSGKVYTQSPYRSGEFTKSSPGIAIATTSVL